MSMIILLTGPSGAGKTTVSKRFLETVDGTWAYLAQDDVRQLIQAGYASADGYESDWSTETRLQWDVSIAVIAAMTQQYHNAGINVLIDCFVSPEELYLWERRLGDLSYVKIVLMPNEEVVVARNAARDDRSRLKERKIRDNWHKFTDIDSRTTAIIDSSDLSVEETASKLAASL